MLINDDCMKAMPKLIEDNVKVDLILTDIPYGTVNGLTLNGWEDNKTKWDTELSMPKMFEYCEQLLRVNGRLILFSQEPYTCRLRSYPTQNLDFSYPLIWRKNHFANNLGCKVNPVSYFEDLTVWKKKWDSESQHPLREYAQNLLEYIGKSYKEVEKDLGHRKAEHFFYRITSSQFSIPTVETYNELITMYNIDKFKDFLPYSELVRINKEYCPAIFNLQGKFMSNILDYAKPVNHNHPTEKPVDLLLELVKVFTNPNDLVLDFTMGSGSTGVACAISGRRFIGIELDEEYFKIAESRINGACKQSSLGDFL